MILTFSPKFSLLYSEMATVLFKKHLTCQAAPLGREEM